eukprot:scaffold65804_cov31-Attheya_sp.AAC.1
MPRRDEFFEGLAGLRLSSDGNSSDRCWMNMVTHHERLGLTLPIEEDTMCSRNVAAEEDRLAIRCRTPGGLSELPMVADDDAHTAMVRNLLYLFDCYDEDSGEYRKPNLTRVELHTHL